ncbi:MAG TPA: radical SAM protein [Ruminococcaceae bacterium]|nr:radical SAM protein [Oscillospiraceae bacterium]
MKHANVAVFVPHVGCPHRCSFCDQWTITGKSCQPTPQDVCAAAETALVSLGKAAARKAEIAFFGGSFTAINAAYRRSLLEAAASYVKNGLFAGIRLSTRPDAIDSDILDELCYFGVTTVELGAQSMDDRVLQKNGRGHTAEQVRLASHQIAARGLHLGLQMMTGLPSDTDEGARYTARCFAELHPEEIRIYPAIVLPGTQLAKWYQEGSYQPETLEEAVYLCTDLLQFFEERGIHVIRLGLHASPELERNRLAGPWHPAFRELCESRRWLLRMQSVFTNLPCGDYTITVPEKYLSQVKGQKKANLSAMKKMGYQVSVQVGKRFQLYDQDGPISIKESFPHADPFT